LGFSSIICQSVFFREFLVIFYGNELVLGFILSAWLLSIALGARAYQWAAGWIKDPAGLFLRLTFLFSLLPLALIPLIRLGRSLSGVDYGLFIPFSKMALLCMALVLAPAFIVGFTFPLGCGVIRGDRAVSLVFMAESAGSLAGGVIFSLFLARHASAIQAGALLLILFLIPLACHVIARQGKTLKARLVVAGFCVLGAGAVIGAPAMEDATVLARWRTLVKDLPLAASLNSPYQNLALTRQEDQYSVFFNGVYGYSFPDGYGDAAAAHHVLAQCPRPDNVLVIGQVTPEFAGECLKEPVKKLTAVYFDPAILQLTGPYLTAGQLKTLADPRVETVFQDGRLFVRTCRRKFDLIYLSLPDPSNALINRHYTVEFFREAARILEPGGVLAVRLTSSENYSGGEVLDYSRTLYRTVREVFPFVALCPSTPSFFFAGSEKGSATEDPAVLFGRYQERNIKDTVFTPYIFESLYDARRAALKREALEKMADAPINSDDAPAAYLQSLRLWDRYSSSRLAPVISFFQGKKAGFYLIFPGAALLLFALYLFAFNGGHRQARILCTQFTVASTGLTAMGLSLILTFTYQNVFGSLYEKLGLLLASFMLGLFLGGAEAGRQIGTKKAGLAGFIAVPAQAALVAVMMPVFTGFTHQMPPVFSFLFHGAMAMTGFLTGQAFPLGAHILAQGEMDGREAAARVDWADHLGGAVGALVMGAFLMPVIGMASAARLLALLEVTALLMWGLLRLKHRH